MALLAWRREITRKKANSKNYSKLILVLAGARNLPFLMVRADRVCQFGGLCFVSLVGSDQKARLLPMANVSASSLSAHETTRLEARRP